MLNSQYRQLEKRVEEGTATLVEEFLFTQEKRNRESAPNALLTQKPNVFDKLGRSAGEFGK